MPARPQNHRPHLPNSPFRREQPVTSHPEFAAGDRVSHDRHGLGSVVRLADDRMVVRFGQQLVSVSQSSPKVHLL